MAMTSPGEHGGVRPPFLPADAADAADAADRSVPAPVRDFVVGDADEVSLTPGRIGWMGLPGDVRPDVRFVPGRKRGSVDIVVELVGLGIHEVRLSVEVRDGGLRVDTTALPDEVPGMGDLRAGITAWARGLDDWLAVKGKEIGDVRLRRGRLRVTKTERTSRSRPLPGRRRGRRAPGSLAAAVFHTVATGVVAAVGVVTPAGGARRHHQFLGRVPASGEADRRTVSPDVGQR